MKEGEGAGRGSDLMEVGGIVTLCLCKLFGNTSSLPAILRGLLALLGCRCFGGCRQAWLPGG